jgi:hypothetical protein
MATNPRLQRARDRVELRIEQLKRDGIEQITTRAELKTMRPEQVAKAREEGRLDGLLAGLYDQPVDRYRTHSGG